MNSDRHSTLFTPWRWMLAVYSLGVLGHYVLSPSESTGDIERLLGTVGFPDEVAHRFQIAIIYVVATAGFLAAAWPGRLSSKLAGRVVIVGAATIGLWRLVSSLIHSFSGAPFALLSLGEHATRFSLPLLMAWALWSLRNGDRAARIVLGRVLRLGCLAVAATFTVHGVKALLHHPGFADLITDSARRSISLGINEQAASSMLTTIGTVDLVVVCVLLIGLLINRCNFQLALGWAFLRIPLRYMFVWGFISAWSRVTAVPFPQSWDEPMIRIANGGLPLLMLLLIRELKEMTTEHDVAES